MSPTVNIKAANTTTFNQILSLTCAISSGKSQGKVRTIYEFNVLVGNRNIIFTIQICQESQYYLPTDPCHIFIALFIAV